MLLHILIDFKKEDNIKQLEYLKILGFNKRGQDYLKQIKKGINIPLKPIQSKTFTLEQKATIIYDLLTLSKEMSFLEANKPVIKTKN